MRRVLAIVLLASSVGCVRYDYFIESPLSAAGQIADKDDTVVTREGLEYRLREVSDRLVLRVFNHSDATINLDGRGSVVVDPTGQSRPVRSQAIAPESFAKLIFPPVRPRVEPNGPSWTFGWGMSSGGPGYYDHAGVGMYDTYPGGYYIDDPAGFYWDWDGEGAIRVTLVYDRGGEAITHEFRISRRKSK